MAADTRQASACHRCLRIDVDWRNDSSYGCNRVTICGILFLLRLVIESECELIQLIVVILKIDIYRLLVFTIRGIVEAEHISVERIAITTAARTIPTHSLELKQVELPVDKDINPDDVGDNFEPQKGLTEENMQELMEPNGILPDPDFDTSMTYEEMNNIVDVLNSDTHSDENSIRAAQTIFHKLPGTELLRLIENELADQQKIDRLLYDYLDEFGRPLPESKRRERKIKDFNIKKYV